MRARRHEEVLEECLSAYLEGRRSIEESLLLYPSLRHDLEPLLQTAALLNDAVQAPGPRRHIQEQANHRFLEAASQRKNARTIVAPVSAPGNKYRLILVGATPAVLAVSILTIGVVWYSGGQDSDDPVARVTTLTSLKAEHAALRDGDVSAEEIRELTAKTSLLAAQVDDPSSIAGLERTIRDQFRLLSTISVPAEAAPEMRKALDVTQGVAAEWGIELSDTTPDGSETPSVTPDDTVSPTPPRRPNTSPRVTPAPSPEPAPSAPSGN